MSIFIFTFYSNLLDLMNSFNLIYLEFRSTTVTTRKYEYSDSQFAALESEPPPLMSLPTVIAASHSTAFGVCESRRF
jgi:hypothetical protein